MKKNKCKLQNSMKEIQALQKMFQNANVVMHFIEKGQK